MKLIKCLITFAILGIALYVSSCKKTENVSGNKLPASLVTDTLYIDGHIKSMSSVSLTQCPFSKNEIFVTKGERTRWNTNSIVKNTYITTSVVAYFIKNVDDTLKTLVIFYNPIEKTKLKMVIAGTRIDDDNVHYVYKSTSNTMHFEITLKSGAEGYNVTIGTPPAFKTLGQSSMAPAYGCLRNAGFATCIECSATECKQTWWCIITCGFASVSCIAGWIVACGILNA